MSSPSDFHLSLRVANLATSRRFYESVLGCPVVRNEGAWIDIDFFGHQLTLHQAREADERGETAFRRLDHFGPILEKDAWRALAARLAADGIPFQLPPLVTGEDTPAERGKFLIVEPDGIGLEFKYRV